jgi:MFS family permease
MSGPYVILAGIVSAEKRPKYYGMLATFSAIGALCGPLITGLIIDLGSTDLAFLSHAIFAIIPLIGLFAFYPNQKRPTTGKFDFAGIAFLIIAVCGLIMWLSLVGKAFPLISLISIALLAVTVICAIILISIERKTANPSVPIYMFKKRRFTATFIIQALLTAYPTIAIGFGIVYIQQVMRATAFASSTATMPQTIVQAILGFFVGAFISKNFKKRFRPMGILSLLLVTVALFLFCILTPTSPMLIIYIATALGGISQAISMSSYVPFFQTELKPEVFAAAQGLFQFGSTAGSCIFVAICGAALNQGWTLNHIFILGTGLCAAALVIAIFCFRFPKEKAASEAA